MYCLEKFCFLCLEPNINTTSYDRNIEEKIKYLIPKYKLQVSKVPKHFCNTCLKTLNSFHKFQQKCMKSIEFSNNYIQKLSHENDTYTCVSVKLTDILQNGCSDTVSLIQVNVRSIKHELKEEIYETNNYKQNENVEGQQKNEEVITIKIENTTNDVVMERKITEELIIKDESSDNIFECDTCDVAFSTKIQLIEHISWCRDRKRLIEVVNQIQNDYESNESSEPTKDTSTHIEASSYSCDDCKKIFSLKQNLNRHRRIHTGEEPYQCNVCKKSFNRKDHLILHRRIHTGEKPNECDFCKKSLSTKSALIRHRRVHTGEKPYECDICKRTFSQKIDSTRHRRIHTGEKPFECDVCDNCFGRKIYLIEHRRIHTGEKPYECDVCKKKFRKRNKLSEHQRIHNGKKPYECDVCKKSFRYKSTLNGHRRVHANEKR